MIALFQNLPQIIQQISGWTYTSMYCGAGGDSYGARVAGAHVLFAINPNQIAITSHEQNFQDCLHLCMDIFSSTPDDYPATDMLWVSADGRNNSTSKGIPLKNQRVRSTLWDDGDHLDPIHRTRMTMMGTYRWAADFSYVLPDSQGSSASFGARDPTELAENEGYVLP